MVIVIVKSNIATASVGKIRLMIFVPPENWSKQERFVQPVLRRSNVSVE
jgi:hypothetical protein